MHQQKLCFVPPRNVCSLLKVALRIVWHFPKSPDHACNSRHLMDDTREIIMDKRVVRARSCRFDTFDCHSTFPSMQRLPFSPVLIEIGLEGSAPWTWIGNSGFPRKVRRFGRDEDCKCRTGFSAGILSRVSVVFDRNLVRHEYKSTKTTGNDCPQPRFWIRWRM